MIARKLKTEGDRAVIYARFSSHNQREVSIEQQVEMCSGLASRNGLTVIDVYSDKAISGKTDNRPSFQRMMRDARAGKFSFVIAWKSNRMGRNMLEAMLNDVTLQELGVRTVYVEEDFGDNAAGRFALRNMMNVNQFYSEAMAEDIRRGLMDNAKKCMVNGRCPYGLRKGADGKYEIVPEQAEIVREIFTRIKDGWPQRDILDDLNARGIRNRDGGIWKRTTFDKMLQNEQYVGVYKYAGIRIEDGIPAILDRDLFEGVQRRLRTQKNPRGKRSGTADYMLTGKLFCGHCGNPMVGISGRSRNGEVHYYYQCQGKHQRKCSKKNERKDQIEEAVITAVKKIIMDDETIDWIIDGYQEFMETLRGQSAVTAMEKELDETQKAIANLMKAIEMGIITDTTKARMMELEEHRRDLETSIRIETSLLQEMDPDQLRFTIERFRDKNINNRAYQKELLHTFVKAIYVYDDRLKIVLNRGPGDNIEIPFDDISSAEWDDDFNSTVCISATKPHHINIIRTATKFRHYGIVISVPY